MYAGTVKSEFPDLKAEKRGGGHKEQVKTGKETGEGEQKIFFHDPEPCVT